MDNNTEYALDIINANHERERKRLDIIIVILIAAIILSNGFWIHRNFNTGVRVEVSPDN